MKQYKNFISFEGIDFSGKTTQLEQLAQRLRAINFSFHLLREPGGAAISEKIRAILLDKTYAEIHPRTEILLYSAARSQLTHQIILPLLKAGEYVIVDRFFDSTTAYQGYGRSLDIAFVEILNRFATSGLFPYRTFLIDISPEEALRRRKAAARPSDRLESENLRFYHTIWEAYHTLAAQDPARFIIIPGEQPVETVAAVVWEKIAEIWDLPPSNFQ